jgi:hypothetical protein
LASAVASFSVRALAFRALERERISAMLVSLLPFRLLDRSYPG